MTLQFLLSLSLPLIRGLLKNPAQKRKLRNLSLQIFQAIRAAYSDDEYFL